MNVECPYSGNVLLIETAPRNETIVSCRSKDGLRMVSVNLSFPAATLVRSCLPSIPGIPAGTISMLLWCPQCGERHIDAGEFATKAHHTHACQECGHVWRPAIVATVGVKYLPGFKDSI